MPKPLLTIREAVEKYLDLDLWVVPCDGKKPIWKDWQNKRRSRKELIKTLKGKKLNIGLVLNQSSLIDIECDSKEAEANLKKLFGGNVPATPTWRSRRGKHRLFHKPKGLPKKAKIEIDGIEFRIGNGKGAFSVVPPSVHPKTAKRYRWEPGLSLDDVEPAELPPEIVERLRAPVPKSTAEPTGNEDIPEGKRNEKLFAKGCSLKRMKLGEEAILIALSDLNKRLCKPPLLEDEIGAIARSVASADTAAKVGFLERLFRDIELWHCDDGDPHITLPQDGHRENWSIDKRARAFRRWLSKMFYDTTGEMLNSSLLSDFSSLLEGKATFDGQSYPLFRRVAGHKRKFYLDLVDAEWRAVEIDAKGWRVVSDPPVKFRRAKAMLPLPMPVKTSGAELYGLICPFLNIQVEQWPLVAMSLIAALRPTGPYPVLKLLGEQGSAKSTTAKMLRSVVDPNGADVRPQPRSTRDLMIAANNSWVICLDNLSALKPDLSDALCRLSTGGGFATRTLYTDTDETIINAMRPVILTSIEEIGTRSDLLERSLIIELPPIHEKKRRAEKTLWRAFEKARPRILGALLDVVSGAIKRLPRIERRPDTELPRLADFYIWGQAAEESLGLEPGTFAEAYTANLEAATQIVLESSPLVTALLRFLKKNPKVEATASGLLEKLGYIDSELKLQPGWPKSPRVLSAILKRAAPNLRQVGIVAKQDTRGGGNRKEKVWRICGPSAPAPLRKAKAGRKGSKGRKITKKISSGLAEALRAQGAKGRKGRKTTAKVSKKGKRHA